MHRLIAFEQLLNVLFDSEADESQTAQLKEEYQHFGFTWSHLKDNISVALGFKMPLISTAYFAFCIQALLDPV